MATAVLILALQATVFAGLAGWGWLTVWRDRLQWSKDIAFCDRVQAKLATTEEERDELLRQKRATPFGTPERTIYPGTAGPFDRDAKIPTTGPRRYVSIAVARAQAEAASLGPQTHRDEVIANDARAMEQA